MDLLEALATRRACRAFLPDPVPPDMIEKLTFAVSRAPTASNRPYRHCIVIDDPDVIRAIRQISPALLADPPLLIVIIADAELAVSRTGPIGESASLIDAGAAGENVLLAATALGLGSQFTMISTQAGIRVILNLPETHRVDLIIPVGFPAGPIRSMKAPREANQVYRNQFGKTT